MPFKKITIERTMCYGDCPIYQAEIHDDGRVLWHGEMYVSAQGNRKHKLTKRKLARLNQEIESFDYYSLLSFLKPIISPPTIHLATHPLSLATAT